MTSSYELQTRRHTSELIIDVLCLRSDPTDLRQIVEFVAKVQNANPNIIRVPIRIILKKGLQAGIIQMNRFGQYSLSNHIIDMFGLERQQSSTSTKKKVPVRLDHHCSDRRSFDDPRTFRSVERVFNRYEF